MAGGQESSGLLHDSAAKSEVSGTPEMVEASDSDVDDDDIDAESNDEPDTTLVADDVSLLAGSALPDASSLQETKSRSRSSIPRGLPEYDGYYSQQQLCTETEWRVCVERLRTPLPPTFRFQDSTGGIDSVEAATLLSTLASWKPEQVAWCPGAYRLTAASALGADGKCDKALNKILLAAQRAALISRQETASMLPVVALGVQPHHNVLELCAAPGSKTMQILDAMHAPRHPSSSSGSRTAAELAPPSGMHVANDFKPIRLHRLVARARRVPASTLLTTCVDARRCPNLHLKDGTRVRFDRVLCDVPCSGDGTVRKAPGILSSWTPRGGLSHHGDQLTILNRGIELLAPGGILAYSTCALNPVECEAVVAAALWHAGGTVEVIPIEVPSLMLHEGVTTWRVPYAAAPASSAPAGGQTYGKWDEVSEGERQKGSIRKSMFPPTEYVYPPEGADRISQQLRRCGRLLPLHDDGSCFFLALLRRNETVEAPLRRGDHVIVKANGGPATVRGPGNGLHKGKLRVRYPDGSHFNCFPDELQRVSAADRSSNRLESAEATEVGEPAANSCHRADDGRAPTAPLSELVGDSDWELLSTFFGLTEDVDHASAVNTDRFSRSCMIYGPVLTRQLSDESCTEDSRAGSICVASGGLRSIARAPNARLVGRAVFTRLSAEDCVIQGWLPQEMGCRWRPTYEALQALATRCTRRVVNVDPELLIQLAAKHEVSADALGVKDASSWPSGAIILATDPKFSEWSCEVLLGVLHNSKVRLVTQKGFRLRLPKQKSSVSR